MSFNNLAKIDAINSNFITAGYRFPTNVLSDLITKYLSTREYIPESKGLLRTRQSIAKYYKLSEEQSDNIIITASTSESYINIFNQLDYSDEILLPCPSYPLFEYLVNYSHRRAKYYYYNSDGWTINIESIIASITPNTKIIVLISPNNPTGSIISKDEFLAIQNICKIHNIKLIVDSVFDIFNYSNNYIISPIDNLFEIEIFWLNGISKMFALPDLKLAWIYYQNPNAHLLDSMETFNDTFLNANYLSQNILPELFATSTRFQSEMLFSLKNNLEIVKNLSIKFKVIFPKGGIHMIISVDKTEHIFDDLSFENILQQSSLHVHPLNYYEFNSKYPSVVITLLHNKEDMQEIVKRLNAIANDYL